MRQFLSHSETETERFAAALAKELHAGDVLAFRGGLGAGKTAFTRGLARGLAVTGEVASPTFSLINEYHGAVNLYHFDMYRIVTLDDLYTTGFFDYLEEGGILAVEWSENIQNALPENTTTITIEPIGEEQRTITIEGDERF